jgi:IclR family acetate operon transcriptional repressor
MRGSCSVEQPRCKISPMSKKAPSGAQAVLRAIAVLKAFTLERPERDVASLSDETGLSRGTVHRLLAALESEGLVTRRHDQGPVGRLSPYRLGPAATALGVRALRSSRLRETAHVELERLAEKTGETATLEVLTDGKMLILDEVLGARLIGASPSLGTAWALHATSTGKAILAALPESRANDLLPRKLARFTKNTITNRGSFDREIERVRALGYATAVEEIEEGYSATGAVIRTPMLEPYAALSLGGPSSRWSSAVVEEHGALVKTRADELSAKLGFET